MRLRVGRWVVEERLGDREGSLWIEVVKNYVVEVLEVGIMVF